ncbi:MAG TPA: hypothetical protein PKY29_04480 [Ferruginibacter sp.]|nr:hypothetical protein [Ferruginibacter sp.]HRQ20545.1 hypothetical protein [Ferruginibacter sp.]
MKAVFEKWIKTGKDYYTGVALAIKYIDDKKVIALLRQGDSTFNKELLMKTVRAHISRHTSVRTTHTIRKPEPVKKQRILEATPAFQPPGDEIKNPELYTAAREEANKVYKEAMNERAVLFKMATPDDHTLVNMPDLIQQRAPIALRVMELYILASKLYEKADYIKTTGRIPGGDEEPEHQDFNLIPDVQVKQTLDNLRKNYNKMKKRERTPERLALLQKHERNIKILEERWRLLK